ncbi:MAG: Fic family protein [Bacilli bacterium]|nr:Fic family protein [Bacilli bacterium]MBN2877105.1 Fic family protein [Bacilli bacterium]
MGDYNRFKMVCSEIDHYPSYSELMYKYSFTREDILSIKQQKEIDNDFIKLPLLGEYGTPILYWNNPEILSHFSGSHDLIRNSSLDEFSDFRDSEMMNKFVFSEIESSLSIEGVRSTRAAIERINQTDYEQLKDKNDIIIKNMILAYEYVKDKEITENNIYTLYQILSKQCLDSGNQLLPGNYYRHDVVHIVDAANAIVDRGIDWKQLSKSMRQLIEYIHLPKTHSEHLVASHIIHFYMIYLHPYFDYNGRMARVLSFWYNIRFAPSLSLLLVSEGVNNKINKNGYYTSISNSRNMNNDITYFLEYMSNIILQFSKVYINYYQLLEMFKTNGEVIQRSVEIALKYVLSMNDSDPGYFDWKDYRDYTNADYSKTQYLNLLNTLLRLDILESKEIKKAKLFRLKKEQWNLI